jgi:ABC-type tungstate transport system permease subunit
LRTDKIVQSSRRLRQQSKDPSLAQVHVLAIVGLLSAIAGGALAESIVLASTTSVQDSALLEHIWMETRSGDQAWKMISLSRAFIGASTRR